MRSLGLKMLVAVAVTAPLLLATTVGWAELPAQRQAATQPDLSAFSKLERDPRPKSITRNAHYVISNENHHHLFEPALSKLKGGVVAGVGSDQMYLFAGWAKPEALVPMDFDQVIVDLHYVYGAMFRKAETPAELIALWSPRESVRRDVRALLDDTYKGDPKQLQRIQQAFRLGQKLIGGRLKRVAKIMAKNKTPSVWTDQAQYDFVRKLWMDGKVFPIRGDLTASKAMLSIAKATRDSGLKMSVFYTSNAEQYFNWSKSFRANVLAQPFSDDGQLLRTFPDGQRSYYYYLQTGKNFQKWIKRPKLRKTFYMIRYHRKRLDNPRFFEVLQEPRKKKRK